MAKILTSDGLKDVDKIRDINIDVKCPEAKEEKKTVIYNNDEKEIVRKQFNDRPVIKENGFRLLTNFQIGIMLFLIFILSIGIISGIIWFNISFSNKSFSQNVTVNNENNIPAPTIPVNVYNNATTTNNVYINSTLQIPKELSDALIKALNKTNSS